MTKIIDLTGQKYHKLTVLHRVEDRITPGGYKDTMWHCRCDCGNEVDVSSQALRKKHHATKSCGCLCNGGKKGINDLTGRRFGKLLVLERAEDAVTNTNAHPLQYRCLCDCGKEVVVRANSLKTGSATSCGFCRINEEYQDRIVITENKRKMVDLTGLVVNRLTVLGPGPDYNPPSGGPAIHRWYCRCECGNITLVQAAALKSGKAKSCGCIRKDNGLERRKSNRFEFREDFVIGYTEAGRPFFIDHDDFDRVKEEFWYESPMGYIVCSPRDREGTVFLHRFIMNPASKKELVDHINHDTFDNRKCNLRIVDHYQSQRNIGPFKNKSGIKGVYLKKGRWVANIKVNHIDHYLGSFDTKEEAAAARKAAEEQFFGEYNYDQSIDAVPRIEGIPWAEPIGRFATTSSAHDGDVKDSVETVDGVKIAAPLIDVVVQVDKIGDEADDTLMPAEEAPGHQPSALV